MLLLLFFGCVFYSINYDIHDIDSYFLLAYVVAGIWSAFGLLVVARLVNRNDITVVLASAALVVGITVGVQWGGVSNSGNHLVEDYTHNMFRSLKPNALVLSYQWDYWVSASYHYQYVDGLRPDVVVIDKELLRRSWYLEQIRRNHPELYARSEPEIRLFLAEVHKFEHDLPYQPEVIEQRYVDVINSFFERNVADRPCYVTPEIEKEFAPGFIRIPEGLAYRLYRPDNLPPPDAPVWDAFFYRPFHRSGRLADGLVGMYSTMLSNRGVLLFQQERYRQAEEYFRRALEFTPDNPQLIEWRQRVASAMRTS
jgi:tetratricopeptide (TPR) repeat protein